MTAIIRLILAVVLFLASLLCVFPPISYFLWEASIAVDELGHWLAIIGFILLIPGWRSRLGKLSTALVLGAIVLLLSPLARGMIVGKNLPKQLEVAFGPVRPRSLPDAPALGKPISFATLFRKPSSPHVVKTTMTYIVRDGKPLQLDVYRNDQPLPPAPLVIAIHGGSWRSGNRWDLPALNYYLAARGYVVATPSYRFAPQFPHPAQSEDIDASIAYLEANAASLGVDPTKIVLLGRSAGAQLALVAAYTRKDNAVRGVVSLYGPTDQKWGWDNPADPRVYRSDVTLRAFLNGTPATAPEAYRASSPINFVGARVPTLMIHGTLDPLVSARQSARLDSAFVAGTGAMRVARVPHLNASHLFIELPWGTHGCDYIFNGPCGQISTYAIERFVASLTR